MNQGWSLKALPNLNDQQFKLWVEFLEDNAGINFAQHKSILQAGLTRRMRQVGVDDYHRYYQLVSDDQQGRIEWAALLDNLTVGETRFFRDPDALSYLAEYAADTLKERFNNDDTFNAWSVGCSTGEEVYSIAMVLDDCIKHQLKTVYLSVLGTDISLYALQQAKKGQYRRDKLAFVPEKFTERYFHCLESAENPQNDTMNVDSQLRQRVCFTRANLMEIASMPKRAADVIFCQNVLIYFRKQNQRQVVNALVDRLKKGGLLVVGMGEVTWPHDQLKRVENKNVHAYIKV